MTIRLFFTLALLFFGAVAPAQRCTLLSMEHFGGNWDDVVARSFVQTYDDGSFAFPISTVSDSGNVYTTCYDIGGYFLRRYDANYTEVMGHSCLPWGQSFFGPSYYVYPQANGDTIQVGEYDAGPGGGTDVGIERRDASGALIWNKHYGGPGAEGVVGVRTTDDGGFMVLSVTNAAGGDVSHHYGEDFFSPDIWVVRLDNDGELVWATVLGGSDWDLAYDLRVAADGGCYVFGYTASSDHDGEGMQGVQDLYIAKLDSAGTKQWHRCLGGSNADGCGQDGGIKTLEDGSGGFYVMAQTFSGDGDVQQRPADGGDFWLLHIDSAAHIIWENTYGGPGPQITQALCRAADGSFWLGGFKDNAPPGGHVEANYGLYDGWVVHTDSLGNFINQIVIGSNKQEQVFSLHPLPDGTVLAAGLYPTFFDPAQTSPGFPEYGEGFGDVFIARLGPETVGIMEPVATELEWSLSPNPASGRVHISLPAGSYPLALRDGQGRLLRSVQVQGPAYELDISGLAPGVYYVSLAGGPGRKLLLR